MPILANLKPEKESRDRLRVTGWQRESSETEGDRLAEGV